MKKFNILNLSPMFIMIPLSIFLTVFSAFGRDMQSGGVNDGGGNLTENLYHQAHQYLKENFLSSKSTPEISCFNHNLFDKKLFIDFNSLSLLKTNEQALIINPNLSSNYYFFHEVIKDIINASLLDCDEEKSMVLEKFKSLEINILFHSITNHYTSIKDGPSHRDQLSLVKIDSERLFATFSTKNHSLKIEDNAEISYLCKKSSDTLVCDAGHQLNTNSDLLKCMGNHRDFPINPPPRLEMTSEGNIKAFFFFCQENNETIKGVIFQQEYRPIWSSNE